MAILSHQKYPLTHLHHLPSSRPNPTRIICSTSITTPKSKSNSNLNHLIIDSTLNQIVTSNLLTNSSIIPITTNPPYQNNPSIIPVTTKPPHPNDPDLKSNWAHRVWLTAGCTTILISFTKSITGIVYSQTGIEPIIAGYLGYILSDLLSGIYHWGIDNYGDSTTPIFGSQIEAFQGHHKYPWTITKRQFANNLHSLARAITFTVLPINLFSNNPTILGFVGVCAGCIMFSQQFHAWAHGTKSKLPPLVVGLQEAGVLVNRAQHGAHHRAPYNNNYCIVSGAWNGVLDRFKVFEALEMVVFFRFGVRPRSWSEPGVEWIEDENCC